MIFSDSPCEELPTAHHVSKVMLRQGLWKERFVRETRIETTDRTGALNSGRCAMRCGVRARSRPAPSGFPRHDLDDLVTDRHDR